MQFKEVMDTILQIVAALLGVTCWIMAVLMILATMWS